jgi:O-antigen ligase
MRAGSGGGRDLVRRAGPMNSLKPLQLAGLALGVLLVLYSVFSHLQYFSNVSFLGAILLIEVIVASLWKYDQRFFALLMIAFLWAGMHVPLQDAWTSARWVVLSSGALVGCLSWMKSSRHGFRSFHLLALFCVGAAFVSATVSPFPQMASFKALSLLLLFLYCASGARMAVLGREERFFHGVLWGCEIAVYATAICYFGFGRSVWGNPNSLGAAMSIGVFPILLWGWLISDGSALKFRRLAALFLCAYLIIFSMARAGMISMILVTLVLFLCLHQYRLLVKVVGLVLLLVAVSGVLAPERLNKSVGNMKDALLYKGHKEEGLLGSRQTPWQKTIATIKEHPWFGTGYGTSPTGDDPGLSFGKFASSAETVREHGSSYMTIAEWVGLLGVMPFLVLVSLTASNVWRVCVWMNRTSDARHYSIPLAMVVLSGLAHASFEDWLFAVGAYPCVYFWVFAFLLADLLPATVEVSTSPVFVRRSMSLPGFRVVVPNR